MEAMRAMKAREVESVRCRSAKPVVHDAELQSIVAAMRTSARRVIDPRVDLAELTGQLSVCVELRSTLQCLRSDAREAIQTRVDLSLLSRGARIFAKDVRPCAQLTQTHLQPLVLEATSDAPTRLRFHNR